MVEIVSSIKKEPIDIGETSENLVFNQSLLYYIFDNPEYIMTLSEDFFLNHIVNNGYHANALCESLGVQEMIINVKGKEYKLIYTKPLIFDSVQDEIKELTK